MEHFEEEERDLVPAMRSSFTQQEERRVRIQTFFVAKEGSALLADSPLSGRPSAASFLVTSAAELT